MFIKLLSYHGNQSSQYNTVTQVPIVLELNHLYQLVPYTLLPTR